MNFQDFWANWPDKRNKATAEKAFLKLRPEDREKAIERAAEWCREWRRQNPQASHIHASTFLNQKRFLDTEEVRQAERKNNADILRMQAEWIREGKQYLYRHLTASRISEMVQLGFLSKEEADRI